MTDLLHFTTRFKSSVKKPLYLFAGAAIGLTLLVGCVDPVEHRVFHPTTPPGVPLPPNSVRDRTLSTAAEDLALPQSELGTLRITEETWSDGCLGIGQANEVCLQSLVEGWQIEVVHEGQSWFYRTDSTGETVRQSFLNNNLPPSLSELVLNAAAKDARARKEQLEIVKAEPRTWDGCLGIEEPTTACSQVLIYGWKVTVIGENRLLVYHTDMLGYQVKLNFLQNSASSNQLLP
ncbi:MAG: hypothetical protein ACFB16_05165 [Phormidesmis sp.]